jgi:hypothetical protein
MTKFKEGFPTHILKKNLHFKCDADKAIYPKGTLVKITLFKKLSDKPCGKIGVIAILNSDGTKWFESDHAYFYSQCPGYDLGFTKKQFNRYFKKINYGYKFIKIRKRENRIRNELFLIENELENIVSNKIKGIVK